MGPFTPISSHEPPSLAFNPQNLSRTSDLQSQVVTQPSEPLTVAAGFATPSLSIPVSPSLLSDPAFSPDPRSHPYFASHYQNRFSNGNIQEVMSRTRKADGLQPTLPETSTLTTDPHTLMTPISTAPPGSPMTDPHITLHGKNPPPYTEFEVQSSLPTESQKSTTEQPVELIIQPSLTHSVTTPDVRPTRPSPPFRPSTSATPQNIVSSNAISQVNDGRRPRAPELDRIDELDETDPLGLPWHHKGPYEALGQPDELPLNVHTAYQPPHEHASKHRPIKPSSSRQAVIPDFVTLNGAVGVSLNLTPGQILPRIPIPGYGYGYGYDPQQPSPRPGHKTQPLAHSPSRHHMSPSLSSQQQSGQTYLDQYTPLPGPSVFSQTLARQPQSFASLRDPVDTQERQSETARRERRDLPRIIQQPTAICEQPADIKHQPAEDKSYIPEDLRYSEAYGGLVELNNVQLQQDFSPQRINENVQADQVSSDIYERAQRHIRVPRSLHAFEVAQNSAVIKPERALGAHVYNVSPSVPTSINPVLTPVQHKPAAINQPMNIRNQDAESEPQNVENFHAIQVTVGADQRSDDVYLPRKWDREGQNSRTFVASPSEASIHQQKYFHRNPSTPQGPQFSVSYDPASAQRQAPDHRSLQSSHSSTSTGRTGGSNKAPQPHYLPKRLVMPTPLQFQTQPQQHLRKQSQAPLRSHSPLPSYDKTHSHTRAQDIPMASGDSRKLLRKRTASGVDMKGAPLLNHVSLPTKAQLPTHVPTPVNELPISSRVAFAAANFGMTDPTDGIRQKNGKAPKRVLSKRRNDL